MENEGGGETQTDAAAETPPRGGAAGGAPGGGGGADVSIVGGAGGSGSGGTAGSGASGGAAPAPLGPFPADEAFATKRETYFPSGAGRTEGIAARGTDLFFCGDRGGIFRLDSQKKLFTYFETMDCGALFDGRDGTLLVAYGRKGLAQIFADGRVGILAELPGGPGFANDLTLDAEGNVYVSNAQKGEVIRVAPSGTISSVATWAGANGLDVDPTSKRLYINGTGGVVRYALGEGGVLGERDTFTTAVKTPDGCTFDAWGNYWVTGFGGELYVFDPQKRLLGSWTGLGSDFSNLTFGGLNEDVIFATHGNAIERLTVGLKGFRGHAAARSYKVLRMESTRVVDRAM